MELNSHYSLFGEPWWLDAVAGPGGWDEVRVESGGHLEARLPYVLTRRRGFRRIGMPPLTQVLGPWFRPVPSKEATALGREKDLAAELMGRLPAHDAFRQNFHPEISNWLPWYWLGYRQTTKYSYVIDLADGPDAIWTRMQSNVRGDARKARDRHGLLVREDLGVDALAEVCALTNARQGRRGPPQDIVRRAAEAASKRGCGAVLAACDPAGRVHAAMLLVWDERRCYYLQGGGDPALRNSGAHSLLVWEAIQRAASKSRLFDFEGSMVESVERFFRAFGARQSPYSQVALVRSRLLRTAAALSAAFGRTGR